MDWKINKSKTASQIIDSVSYALKMGVIHVFVVYFRS